MRGILCYSFIVLSAFTICINGHVDSSPPPADADGIHHHRRFLRQSLRLVNTLLKSENGSRRLQLEQSDCTPPQFGCGRGLWNENSCECDCLPDHCLSEIYNSCQPAAPGSCPNVFEGCTPFVDCFVYPNTMSGLCESGPTLPPGITSIYRTMDECCRDTFSADPSVCLATDHPSSSPSIIPSPAPTFAPTVPKVLVGGAGSQQSQTSNNNPQNDNSEETTILLSPIQISFTNLPPQFELDDEKRQYMATDVIQNLLYAPSDELGVTITSIDIVENIFSPSGYYKAGDSHLLLELRIEISGERYSGQQVYDTYLEVLRENIYMIADMLEDAWGPTESYTNDVLLDIAGANSSLSSKPSSEASGGVAASNSNEGTNNGVVPVWAVVLFSLLFALLFGGLLLAMIRRSRDKNDKDGDVMDVQQVAPADKSSSFYAEEFLVQPQSRQKNLNQSRHSQMTSSVRSRRSTPSRTSAMPRKSLDFNSVQLSVANASKRSSRSHKDRPSIINEGRRGMDPSAMNLFDENSIIEQSLDPPLAQSNNKTIDDGYDGGKSSFLLNRGHGPDNDNEDSSDEDEEDDDASAEEGYALGLLYYDGASSAGESEGWQSGKSRRSRRTNKSGRSSRYDSGKSKSSGRSRKSKTTQRSRRKKTKPILEEEEEQQQQRQREDPDGYLDGGKEFQQQARRDPQGHVGEREDFQHYQQRQRDPRGSRQQQQQKAQRDPDGFLQENVYDDAHEEDTFVTKPPNSAILLIGDGDENNSVGQYTHGSTIKTHEENTFVTKPPNPLLIGDGDENNSVGQYTHGSTIKTDDSHRFKERKHRA